MKVNNEGISMILVLWIITILTVLTTATALMTSSDISSTLNLVKRTRTIRSAETASEFVISFLPEYKDLRNLPANVTIIDEGDTISGHKLALNSDSSDIGAVTPLPLISSTGSMAESEVNPVFTSWAAILNYDTRGMISQKNEFVAERAIEVSASFSVPGGEAMMGHTMY